MKMAAIRAQTTLKACHGVLCSMLCGLFTHEYCTDRLAVGVFRTLETFMHLCKCGVRSRVLSVSIRVASTPLIDPQS